MIAGSINENDSPSKMTEPNFIGFSYIPADTNWNDFETDSNIIKNEMNKREPFTSVFYTSNDEASVSNNINTINLIQTEIDRNKKNVLINYSDISETIDNYTDGVKYLSIHNNKYHYNDQLDPNTILSRESKSDIKTKVNTDINDIKLYQNSIYITSAIACATLLITAIIIAPAKT